MKASEALSLGRTITDNPERGNINSCALGMILNAIGVPPVPNWRTFGNERTKAVIIAYPWMQDPTPEEFQDKHPGFCSNIYGNWIADTFNCHVMGDQTMTLDQLHDIIAEIEPDCGVCNSFDCTCLDKILDNLVQEHTVSLKEIA